MNQRSRIKEAVRVQIIDDGNVETDYRDATEVPYLCWMMLKFFSQRCVTEVSVCATCGFGAESTQLEMN